jgi:hypothetical protein
MKRAMNIVGIRMKAGIYLVGCVVVMLLLGGRFSARGEDVPIISHFVRPNLFNILILYTNCSDPNFDYLLQTSTNLVDWADLRSARGDATNSAVTNFIATPWMQSFYRVVKTPHIPVPIFTMAIMASSNIDLLGNGILVDSFDSSDTHYSTAGQYDVAKRRDHGDVGTDLTLVDSLDIGNAEVYGKVHTGPGSLSTTVAVGAAGSVSDLTWQSGGMAGIQPGAWLYDMNASFPDVIPPSGPGIAPGSGIYQGTNYNYMLAGGLYTLNTALSGTVVVTQPNTILWAKAGINFSGSSDGIRLTPGASLLLYVGDSNGSAVAALFGSTYGANTDGYARNLQIYGLPTCTSISVRGGGQFCGTIYAPQADFAGGGGGTSTTHFYGSLITKSVVVNGHCEYHYDENLMVNGPSR